MRIVLPLLYILSMTESTYKYLVIQKRPYIVARNQTTIKKIPLINFTDEHMKRVLLLF